MAVPATKDATKLGGFKPNPIARCLRPLGVANNETVESIRSCIPEFTSDAVKAIALLATSQGKRKSKRKILSKKQKSTIANVVSSMTAIKPQDMSSARNVELNLNPFAMRKFLKQNPHIAKHTEAQWKKAMNEASIEDKNPPWDVVDEKEASEFVGPKQSAEPQAKQEEAVESKPDTNVVDLAKYADELRQHMESDVIVSEKFSHRTYDDMLLKMVSHTKRLHIPKGYRDWLELNTPITRKSGKLVFKDLITDYGVPAKKVWLTLREPVYLADGTKIGAKEVTKLVEVPVAYDGDEPKLQANTQHFNHMKSAHGSMFQGFKHPKDTPKAAANEDLEIIPSDTPTVGIRKVLGVLDYEDSVMYHRRVRSTAHRVMHYKAVDIMDGLIANGYSFTDVTLKHIPRPSLASETETTFQSDVVVETNEVPAVTPTKKSPYRSPTGRQMYEDGLAKVKALDHAQQTEYYLASKTCMSAWRKERDSMLKGSHELSRLKKTLRQMEKDVVRDADYFHAESRRYTEYWQDIFDSEVTSQNRLLIMEILKPSRDIDFEMAMAAEWEADKRRRILKQMAAEDEARKVAAMNQRHEKKRAKSFSKTDRTKDPYRLGLVADRKDPANDKVERAAKEFKPTSVPEQALIDKYDTVFKQIVESAKQPEERMALSSKINDLVSGKVVKLNDMRQLIKDAFTTNSSGILVPDG